MSRRGVASCALAALLFGASTPAASVIARDMPALLLAGLLYLGAAVAVSPWWVVRRPGRDALRLDASLLIVAIVAGGAIGPALLTAGLTQTSAATASLLLNMELVATIILSATLFREHLGSRMWVAAGLVSVAGVLLVWDPSAQINAGALLIVGACACWGLDNSVTSRIDHVTPQHVTFLKGVVAGSINLALGLVVADGGGLRMSQVLGALAVGALGYGASITLWVRGAQQLGAARGQVIFATAPFLGATLAWVVLRDPLEPLHVAATMIAAIGIAVSLRSHHLHSHDHLAMAHSHEHDHSDGHHVFADHDVVEGRHSHHHDHHAVTHEHGHVPDLHHRHDH